MCGLYYDYTNQVIITFVISYVMSHYFLNDCSYKILSIYCISLYVFCIMSGTCVVCFCIDCKD